MAVALPRIAGLGAIGCVEAQGDWEWGLHERRVYPARTSAAAFSDEGHRGFRVIVPLGIDRDRIVIDAQDSVRMEDGAKILAGSNRTAYVVSGGRLETGAGVHLGTVYGGGGGILLGPGTTVTGFIKTCGPLAMDRDGVAHGIFAMERCSREEFDWEIRDSSSSGRREAVMVGAGQREELAPGSYDEVSVRSHGVLVLHAGSYSFQKLAVDDHAALDLNNTRGPLYIWVRDALEIKGDTVDYSLEPNVLFGYDGTRAPIIGSVLRGTFVLPTAVLDLPAGPAPHSGSFFAASVHVAAEAAVELRPFSPTPPPSDAAIVCDRCRIAALGEVRACCADWPRGQNTRDGHELCDQTCDGDRQGSIVCRMRCTAGVDRKAEEGRHRFAACLRATSVVYGQCLLHGGYRPDTCAKLGFRGYEPASCGE